MLDSAWRIYRREFARFDYTSAAAPAELTAAMRTADRPEARFSKSASTQMEHLANSEGR
jgi:hypothetical protein